MQQFKKTVSFSANAVNVFFHILTRCNLSCRHCYINPEQQGSGSLSPEVMEKWLNILKGGHMNANLIFLGGEPTLHPDLADAIKAARKIGYTSITVDTNGYLFHDILEKTTPEEVDFFSFSLDGATRETNDGIRGKGCFETCVSGIRKAKGKGFSTSLIYTVSSLNIHELEKMPFFLEKLPLDRFFIQVIGIRGKSAGPLNRELQVSGEKWLDTVLKTAEKIAGMGIPVSYPKVFLNPNEPFQCAGKAAKNYFVFPNGRVYQCPLCEDFPLHSLEFKEHHLVQTGKINEMDLFGLDIPEGCVMNKLIQPENLDYLSPGVPKYKIACCLLKEEIGPENR
jgi:MoaA/NifB/PqqE/SkfB family radical SAM enzyme